MRALRALAGPLLLSVAVVAAFRAPLPYYTEQPGALFGLGTQVRVEGHPGPLRGEVLFATINVRTATLAGIVRAAADRQVRLVRKERLIPEGLDPPAFFAQQQAEFRLAADVAAAVGLRAAGLPVEPDVLHGDGALVLRVLRASPGARAGLRPGDVVTAVGDRAVRTEQDFREAVRDAGWDPVRLRVDRPGAPDERLVGLAPAPDRHGRPELGIVPSTYRPRVLLPVAVHVGERGIGGPSAGLAVALAVFDLVSPQDLLAGRRVAVTGSVDPAGAVEPIGGIALKAAGAARDGAELFLVPAGQEVEARRALPVGAPPKVVGVATVDAAIRALGGCPQGQAVAVGAAPYTGPSPGGSIGRVDGEVPCDVAP